MDGVFGQEGVFGHFLYEMCFIELLSSLCHYIPTDFIKLHPVLLFW